MRARRYLAALACLGAWLAVSRGGASMPPANPEDGQVVDGAYTNEYFKIVYPLPSGWSKGRDGPAPSYSGYYVLTALTGGGDQAGTMLIAAQDRFFAITPSESAAEMVDQFHHRLSEVDDMTIDHDPFDVTIAGRRFTRLEFSGVGLFRAMLVTEIRCHFVSFNLTTGNPEELVGLVLSLGDLSLGEIPDPSYAMPVCVKDYATAEHLLSRVEPNPAGPKFTSIPVRIIIGVNGRIKHIHVIRGSAEQRESITAALTQWQFRPFSMNGRTVEVETGVTFRF
jgi:hypothetical protein